MPRPHHTAPAHIGPLHALPRSTGRTAPGISAPTASGQSSNRSGATFPSAVLSAQLADAHSVRRGRAPVLHPATSAAAADPTPTSTDTADWQCIRDRESGDEYNNPAEPSGAYGILLVTWQSNGYSGWPYEAPAATQNALALKLYHEFGWAPWSSRYSCGL